MGDWAQGEFQVANQVAGTDYTCLPGLGLNAYLSTGGDAFYFPKNKSADVEAAQKRLAALLVSPEVQVDFNLKKGSLPIRGDVDLSAANDCMKKGLELLAQGNLVPSGDMAWSPDVQKQNEDLLVEFWKSDMAPADAHAKWVENLKSGL
jgi:glucose/mannose transport system substrate-binding protein